MDDETDEEFDVVLLLLDELADDVFVDDAVGKASEGNAFDELAE